MSSDKVLRGNSVVLTMFNWEKDDVTVLHRFRNSHSYRGLCSTRRNRTTLEEFTRELQLDFERDRWEQYIIREVGGLAVGTIYAYSCNMTDGHCFITAYLEPKATNRGYGLEAGNLVCRNLFSEHEFFKIYAEAYEYNKHSVYLLEKNGFKEEGRFNGHRIYHKKRYSLLRFAFYRSQLEA